MFRRGFMYSRREIHAALGGDVQSYLPHVAGRVVAACLKPETDPDAPDVILVGRGEWIERSADMLVAEGGAVPTFIKRGPGRWEYVGDYRAVGAFRDPADIAPHARRSGRRDITLVIRMVSA
jgi:hypothetical protein